MHNSVLIKPIHVKTMTASIQYIQNTPKKNSEVKYTGAGAWQMMNFA